jgi:hypothetical protein
MRSMLTATTITEHEAMQVKRAKAAGRVLVVFVSDPA